MVKGITKSGFTFEVNKEAFNNMELLDALNEMDKNLLAVPHVCKMLLGENGKKALYDHLRLEDGRVPVDAVTEEIKDIFISIGKEGKNF